MQFGLAGPGSVWRRPRASAAGWLAGWWHGMLFPLSFWVSLAFDSVRIYETNNTGRWYDFGFLIGTCMTVTIGGVPIR